MVYIYAKKKGGKTYYYLRASVKQQGKMHTKDIAYLGDDPAAIRERLATIPATYADRIRKSYKTIERFLAANHALAIVKKEKHRVDDYLGKERTMEVAACKHHYEHHVLALDATTREEIVQNFVIEFSFNTTSLEGNTVTLKEAERLLLEQRTPKNKTLREVYDIQNTSAVFHWLHAERPALSHATIQEVHKRLMTGIDKRTGYRTQDIRVYKSHFDASPAPYVQADMDLLLRWYADHATMHPFVLAALFHHKFEKIHPFMDGNGRTGRMLANLILLHHAYPPLLITKRHRPAYLSALGKADKEPLDSDAVAAYTPLVHFVADEYTKNYWNIFL